jgi:uncharacterized membrane protein YphA (DoxX/SURF4 family)
MEWLKGFGILIGRILLVLIFLKSGIGKIENFEGTAQYMASNGIAPYTNFFLVGAIFFELAGSITVILGYFARFGAMLLLLFLIPTTLIFHNIFVDSVDPKTMIEFMKNVAMFGGLLVLLAVGAGRFSLDYFFRSGKK